MKTWSYLSRLIICTLPWTVLGAVVHAQPVPIHIRIGIGGDASSSEPLFAKETGIFLRHRIDADITFGVNGVETAKAISSGKLDLGYGNVITTIQANQRGEHFVLLATGGMYQSTAPITVLAQASSSDFRTGKDLNGKNVATPFANDLGQISVMAWVDKNGGDSRTLNFIHGIPIPDVATALAEHRIDAGLITEPQWSIQRDKGVVKLLAQSFDAIAPRYANSAFFTKKEWVEANPEAARRFAAALHETAVWANGHHAEAQVILAKHMNVPSSDIKAAVRITYAEELQSSLLQPPLDAAAKYGLIPPTRAVDLMVQKWAIQTNP